MCVEKKYLLNTTLGRPALIPKPSESITTVPDAHGTTEVQGTTENLSACEQRGKQAESNTSKKHSKGGCHNQAEQRTIILAGEEHQRRAEQTTKQHTSSETTEAGKPPGSKKCSLLCDVGALGVEGSRKVGVER